MTIQIKINTTQVEKGLNGIRSDFPWVIQNTVNDLLKMAQEAQYTHMRQAFTIRNESFLKNSVRITQFARRNNPTGVLAITDLGGKNTSQIWERFEGGGTKTPRGRFVSIPSNEAWSNRGRQLPANRRPNNLQRSFVIRKNGTPYIFVRRGRGSRGRTQGNDPNIAMFYTLKSGVRIPDKLRFYDTTIPVVERNFQSKLDQLLGVSLKKRGFTPR
jgi:hypothetical protein